MDGNSIAETHEPDQVQPAKVQAARKLLLKPSDLFDAAEGSLIAMRALRFREHLFEGEDEPTTVAEVAVVDLEGPEPEPLGIVEITWKRVVRQLLGGDADSWQIGKLSEESEYRAKYLEPPGEEDDLEAIAVGLGRLEAAALARPKQTTLAAGEAAEADDFRPAGDDDIPW